MADERVCIHTPFIRLDSFLKFCGAVSTGGEAKIRITEGEITVNGEPCLMRGKKIVSGDRVTVGQTTYEVTKE